MATYPALTFPKNWGIGCSGWKEVINVLPKGNNQPGRMDMNRQEVMELFNKKPRIGTLSTANKKGEVNVAVFGSPQMIDENTVVMGIGRNRTFRNLQENPKAVFIVMEPGKTAMDWKGARVYLEVVDLESGGGFFDEIKAGLAKTSGKQAADMIHAAVRFTITEVRAVVEF
jgi:hypothetical protein